MGAAWALILTLLTMAWQRNKRRQKNQRQKNEVLILSVPEFSSNARFRDQKFGSEGVAGAASAGTDRLRNRVVKQALAAAAKPGREA